MRGSRTRTNEAVPRKNQLTTRIIEANRAIYPRKEKTFLSLHPLLECLVKLHLLRLFFPYYLLACLITPNRGFKKYIDTTIILSIKMFAWLTGTETTPPAFLELRSSYWLILVTVSAAIFTDVFLYGIIVPVLPFALHGRAGIAENDVQPTISILLAAYGGSLLVGAPICGWASDRFDSRRWPFMVGLLALAGSTVFLVVGNSLALIVVGRVLQGLSAAVVWVVGLALLNDTVGSDAIGEAMGVVGIAMSMAYLLGPLLGGIVFKQSVCCP